MLSRPSGFMSIGSLRFISILALAASPCFPNAVQVTDPGSSQIIDARSIQAAATASLISTGDSAWHRRADGSVGDRADAATVKKAIGAYEEALALDTASSEVRWKLLRAMFFYGNYVLESADEKEALFGRGKVLADESLARVHVAAGLESKVGDMSPAEIADALREVSGATETYFWSTAHWGLWGKYHGKLAAAKQGVAKRIRDLALVVIGLDELFQAGGGHRIIGRLHTEAPRVPFFTGWIDRDLAVSETERACELAPDEPVNLLYLAEALLEFEPDRRTEALEILRDLANRSPRSQVRVEEERILTDARNLLIEWED